jgi:DNA invertase Pin-like site-specific DNA recombinase
MKIAFYGRYSSDNQREASIEDQRRVVKRWAERLGHESVADFSDSATSGASLQRLARLQAALRAACTRPAPFDALVVDQLSRLSRDVGDTDAIIKRLRFFGVRVIAVSDGLDTGDENTKISVTVKSLVNELYLDDLRKSTKRGLEGRFLKGFSTGGRTWGYRSEPVYDPAGRTDPRGQPVPVGYRLTIVPEEAGVVREAFRLFREGVGEKAIAKQLNSRFSGRTWRPNTIYLMLQNSRYIGRFYFNRREFRKNPETGRRVFRWRPDERWECLTIDELRIIDDETWEAVQQRIRTRRHLFSRGRSATVHLLSGILVCDACGGRLSIVAKDYYGCRNYAESGTCSNDLRIHREAIEEMVIEALARQLPQWIEILREAATRRPPAPSTGQSGQTRHRLAGLRKEAEAVMQMVRHGHLRERALEEALATYQQIWDQVETLEREREEASTEDVRTEVRYDRSVVEDFVAHLPEALRSETRLGREFLRETLKHVRVEAQEERPTRCPVCHKELGKLTPQHLGRHGLSMREGYRRFPQLGFTKRARLVIQPSPEGLLQTGEVFGLLVAGAGFEPATFGL